MKAVSDRLEHWTARESAASRNSYAMGLIDDRREHLTLFA